MGAATGVLINGLLTEAEELLYNHPSPAEDKLAELSKIKWSQLSGKQKERYLRLRGKIGYYLDKDKG